MANGEEVIKSIWTTYDEDNDKDKRQFVSNTKLSFTNIATILGKMHDLMEKNSKSIEELKNAKESFFARLGATKATIVIMGIVFSNSVLMTAAFFAILKALGKI